MYSVELLHIIRDYELGVVQRYFPEGSRILEIGGGTGYQAKSLTENGYQVESIDLPDSNYVNRREYPVLDYDGRKIPFPDDSFDVVFSSNVLEHVRDLPLMHREVSRVLKPNGICIHVMPSASWRWWSPLTHYIDFVQRVVRLMHSARSRVASGPDTPTSPPTGPPQGDPSRGRGGGFQLLRRGGGLTLSIAKLVACNRVPSRHGEVGNAITELVTFSRAHWVKHFRQQQWQVVDVVPIGITYSGHLALGRHWSMASRRRWAKWLDSSCIIYQVKPPPQE